MSSGPTGRDSTQFLLRLPDGMRDRLKAEAEANKRSMNAEIVARLESSFVAPEKLLVHAHDSLSKLDEENRRAKEFNDSMTLKFESELARLQSVVDNISKISEDRIAKMLTNTIEAAKSTIEETRRKPSDAP